MLNSHWSVTRRRFIQSGMAFSALATFSSRASFAEHLDSTPPVTEGPFYPDKLPLDTDNDLLIVNNNITQAVGEVTHLTGKVLDSNGSPIRNAIVEIWQCDSGGAYLHTRTGNADHRDKNFQGFGRFLTDNNGAYYFRTIKPVPYPGRTPHIHYKIKKGNKELLTTQLFIEGHEGNKSDGIFRGIRDPLAQQLVLVDFKPLKDSKIGELTANFNIVIGQTPADPPK